MSAWQAVFYIASWVVMLGSLVSLTGSLKHWRRMLADEQLRVLRIVTNVSKTVVINRGQSAEVLAAGVLECLKLSLPTPGEGTAGAVEGMEPAPTQNPIQEKP